MSVGSSVKNILSIGAPFSSSDPQENTPVTATPITEPALDRTPQPFIEPTEDDEEKEEPEPEVWRMIPVFPRSKKNTDVEVDDSEGMSGWTILVIVVILLAILYGLKGMKGLYNRNGGYTQAAF